MNKANQPLIHQELEKWSSKYMSGEILDMVRDYMVNRRGPGTLATAKMTDIKEVFEDHVWGDRRVFGKFADSPPFTEIASFSRRHGR